MSEASVILAIEPRLLRGFLHRAIAREPGLCVVAESDGLTHLSASPEARGPSWLIVSLDDWERLPLAVDALLSGQPTLGVVGIADDGSRARVRPPGSPELELDRPSLPDLMSILRGNASP